MSTITAYLNAPIIKRYLNISTRHDKEWRACTMAAGAAFVKSGDVFTNHESCVAELLNDSRVRMLLGDADTLCNWSGIQVWAAALEWTCKSSEFSPKACVHHLQYQEGVMVRSYNHQFTFLRLFDSGQMVLMDQPAIGYDQQIYQG
jgi:carboxypeptidase C (cathepsin A)